MLNYTGHPLVDVGVATITAFAGKDDPADLTETDLDEIADYIAKTYTQKPLIGFIHGAIFPNSGYTNPGIKPDKRLDFFGPVLYGYRRPAAHGAKSCVCCGQPAIQQIARDYFPLLTGRGVINFYPEGEAGLPICGRCLLAVQAYPLGSGGLMLVVDSDNQEILSHFARKFLDYNRKAINLAQLADDKTLLRAERSQKTLLIETMLDARIMQKDYQDWQELFSITAYQLSNSGQSPSLEIYHLPLQSVAFLQEMYKAEYQSKWQAIVRRAWEIEPKKKKGRENVGPFKPWRNWLYEDLFDLPGNATRFIRTYFLRIALRYVKNIETDPRSEYSLQTEAGLVSWKVTAKFLERILHMDRERIEQIRKLGDSLAEYVKGQNDRRFFREFFTVQRYDYFRNILLKASLAQTRRGQPPLIGFDTYISIFEDGEDLARLDWKLARDLVLIRLVEQLYGLKWLGENLETISDIEESSSEAVSLNE
jgi:CRISPR-associated protein Cst1